LMKRVDRLLYHSVSGQIGGIAHVFDLGCTAWAYLRHPERFEVLSLRPTFQVCCRAACERRSVVSFIFFRLSPCVSERLE
jgi:hypothetical protein